MTRVLALGTTAAVIVLVGLAGSGALWRHSTGMRSSPHVTSHALAPLSSNQPPQAPSPAKQIRPMIHLREPRTLAVSRDGAILALDGSSALIGGATTIDGNAKLRPVTLREGGARWMRLLFGGDGRAYGVLQDSTEEVVRLVPIGSDGQVPAGRLLRVVGGAGDRRSSRSVLGRILGGLDRDSAQVLRAERPTSTVFAVGRNALIYAQVSSRLLRIKEGNVSTLTERGFMSALTSAGASIDVAAILGTVDGDLPIVARREAADLVVEVIRPDRTPWSVRISEDERQPPSAAAMAHTDRIVLMFPGRLRVVEQSHTGIRDVELVPVAESASTNRERSLSIAVRYRIGDGVIERTLSGGEAWRLTPAAPTTTDAPGRAGPSTGAISPDGRWWVFAHGREVYRVHLPEAFEEIWRAWPQPLRMHGAESPEIQDQPAPSFERLGVRGDRRAEIPRTSLPRGLYSKRV